MPGLLESVDHIFRTCATATVIWKHFLPANVLLAFSNLNFEHWVRINLRGRIMNDFTSDWSSFFAWQCIGFKGGGMTMCLMGWRMFLNLKSFGLRPSILNSLKFSRMVVGV